MFSLFMTIFFSQFEKTEHTLGLSGEDREIQIFSDQTDANKLHKYYSLLVCSTLSMFG